MILSTDIISDGSDRPVARVEAYCITFNRDVSIFFLHQSSAPIGVVCVYFGDYRVVCDLSVGRAGNTGNGVERWTPRARCANGCSKQSFCAAGEVRFTLPLARCFDG